MWSPVVETALGLCMVFYLSALFTAGAVEWCAGIINKRAKTLLAGMQELLHPTSTATPIGPIAQVKSLVRSSLTVGALDRASLELVSDELPLAGGRKAVAKWAEFIEPKNGVISVQDIMSHALVQPLKKTRLGTGKTRNPSYIPGDVFAKALVDVASTKRLGNSAANADIDDLAKAWSALDDEAGLSSALRAIAKAANGRGDELLKGIEEWYGAQMDRIAGAYKRWAKRLGILVAAIVVCVLHVDAVGIASALWVDGTLRADVVTSKVVSACEAIPSQPEGGGQTRAECALAGLNDWNLGGLPVGVQEWSNLPKDPPAWWLLALGLALSVVATSMGAPFWFGVINKLVNVRNSGNPPSGGTAGTSE